MNLSFFPDRCGYSWGTNKNQMQAWHLRLALPFTCCIFSFSFHLKKSKEHLRIIWKLERIRKLCQSKSDACCRGGASMVNLASVNAHVDSYTDNTAVYWFSAKGGKPMRWQQDKIRCLQKGNICPNADASPRFLHNKHILQQIALTSLGSGIVRGSCLRLHLCRTG